MGPRLAQRLKDYVAERYGSTPAPEQPMFTFNSKRGSVDEGTISITFHALLPKLELHIPPGVSPPRLHDLRHSFAVATLLRWYREGIDPNCRLMHLATFLGHVDPTSTSVYLTITEELFINCPTLPGAGPQRRCAMKSVGQVMFAFFEDHLKTQKGLRPGSVRSYRDTMKLFLAYVASQLPASDHTADPVRPVCTASARLPAHDRGHARKSREHTQSEACRSAYFLPLRRPPISRDAG